MGSTHAQERITLPPPFITFYSETISNEEFFYVGGKNEVEGSSVQVYFQNIQTGETFSKITDVTHKGDWLYSHDQKLPSGRYLLWAQTRLKDALSPPGPQITMTVTRTALQLGVSRLSYETMYLALALFMFVILLVLCAVVVHQTRHLRLKKARLQKEVKEAEDSIRAGFATLYNDIQSELRIIHEVKLKGALKGEEAIQEARLLEDLKEVQAHIGEEVEDIEREI